MLTLTLGVSNAIMKLSSFGAVLWSLSGLYTVSIGSSDVAIPRYMVWLALMYAGVGSVLIHRPKWLFLDEATSALDESNEDMMYTLLKRMSPETTVISVAHRLRLKAYHNKVLTLAKDGWTFGAIDQ